MLARIFNYFYSWYEWAFPPKEPEVEMFFRGFRPCKKYSVIMTPPPKCRLKPPLYPRKKPPLPRKRPRLNIEEDYLMRL